MAYPVPENWTICGALNKSGIPFSDGKVYAYCQASSGFIKIAESGISADGTFSLTFSRWNFQQGDESLEYPALQIRVEDYQGNLLWASDIYQEPDSALNVGNIDISKSSSQNGDCRIFGTVKNEQGNVLAGRKIRLYCLNFVEESQLNAEPSGYFRRILLGEAFSDVAGKYERRYSSSLLPAGLLLDSKEDFGKDKVSLYGEVYEEKEGKFSRVAIEHLVFNGKTEQKIDFVLKSRQENFECEYEKLDSVLKIYCNAVIDRNGAQAPVAQKINAIKVFLTSNTEFPLVVGRERISENEVHAYFVAQSLCLQLQIRLVNDSDKSRFLTDEYSQKNWAEIFFALALRAKISTIGDLTALNPTVVQKILFGAVSDGLICSLETSPVLDFWKKLVNEGSRPDESKRNDDLTISQLLSLYIKGDLSIFYPEKKEGSNGESVQELPHYVPVESFDDAERAFYENLLEAYYESGADIETCISQLQLSEKEISKLKSIFDLNEFFEKFAPGVVCAYRYALSEKDFEFERFSDLIRLEKTDWEKIVKKIAEEYHTLYRYGENSKTDSPEALPSEFPGTNVELKKTIYARALSERIVQWFPQKALLWKLNESFEDQEWKNVFALLMSSAWEEFSLSNSDVETFVESFGESISQAAKEKVQLLQRLYHLTEDPAAIFYLIEQGFDSAYRIAALGENEFVALHGNRIGSDEARQIHRLAQNYMAEAALNIQAYVANSAERDKTLPALPRALSAAKTLKASSVQNKNREASRNTINWAKLFGNINFTKATQGQSILSASAYYVDLLKFLKKSSAYGAFVKRRPDCLDLKLTKANAEISVPTIDLCIELLESLVLDRFDVAGKACPIANNNPDDVTTEKLRAEPLAFQKDGVSIDAEAMNLLSGKIYPFELPENFHRAKAEKILSNLALHFYDIADALNAEGRRELRLDSCQRSLLDLTQSAQFQTWELWGLQKNGNSVLFPDKNSSVSGDYISVLKQVAIFLQRTGFTIQNVNEILANANFSEVRYAPKDSESYQLSNINGYEFVAASDTVDWDLFFRKIAVLLHRKKILGWNLSDVLLTWNLPIEDLDVICELRGRYDISVQDALVLGCKQKATKEFVNSVYRLPGLLSEGVSSEDCERKIFKLLTLGLGLSAEDAKTVYQLANKRAESSFLKILLDCYRYHLISETLKISLSELGKILEFGVWKDSRDFIAIRSLFDKWRILSGTSIDADFYLDLLAPVSAAEKSAAAAFEKALNEFNENKTPENPGQEENSDEETSDDSDDANLKLFICAEFGIAEENFDSLAKTSDWKNIGKENFAFAYANLARKVSLFNYLQTPKQGIDLKRTNFVQSESEGMALENLWKLVNANFVTDRLLSGEYDLERLIKLIQTDDGIRQLEEILALDLETIEQLRNDAFGGGSDFDDPSCWLKFAKAYELYSKTHMTLSGLELLLHEDDEEFALAVERLESAVKVHTKESEWLSFAREMNDELRRKKRDALASYVCWESCSGTKRSGRYPQEFSSESDIYAYYLLDAKMEPDMAISRIVQASASIQLFVQRAELGLEGANVLNDGQRSEWEWMKNYRVWEAARKVFLYPENWIASDLREDKTPFFEELEDRIQESAGDHGNLESALSEYLEKVREVSGIEIVGATKEDGGDEGGILYTLHIVGRTQGEPHKYYYRKYKAKAILSGEWTPWERLDVDISAETIAPAVVNQRLYLLWPQITLGQRNCGAVSDGGMETVEYFAKIQVCWTSHTGTGWTGIRMSKNSVFDVSTSLLDFTLFDNEDVGDRYSLKTKSSSDGVEISIIKTSYHYQEYEEVVGSTEIMDGSTRSNKATKRVYDKSRQYFRRLAAVTIKSDGSDSAEIDSDSAEAPLEDFAPQRTRLVHGTFVEDSEFTCGDKGLRYPENTAILNYTPGRFRIIPTNLSMIPVGDEDETEDLPFFYMDGRRTFFVLSVPKDGDVNTSQKNYRFELLSHSLVDDFYRRYRDGGLKWLYTRETQALPISDSYYYSYSYYNYYFSVYLGYYMAGDWQAWDLGQNIFRFNYRPDKNGVDGPYPAPMVDFVWGGANAMYNWELFFYVPMLIAEKMLAEQNFEEALLWLQLVFDPKIDYTSYERTKHFVQDLPKGARYWKFLPFFANKDADKSILQMLGLPTNRDRLPDRTALSSLVDKWKNDPFNPHLIARYRNVAYQKYVVMKYLDALIGWGDQEFAKDTTESVNLAVQFYLLAAELLGPKNAEAPEPEPATPQTARALLSQTDDLGNAFVQYENSALIGRDKEKTVLARVLGSKSRRMNGIVESMFYFTVPRNDVLFSYWDTIADRLYKIRNSMNIDGVKRTLALFAPPIDPGMLVKARAMGVSIDAILNSSDSNHSAYRFRVIVKLAIDMAKDAAQMGRDLLAILEKKDAEQLRIFKAKCEKAVVEEVKAVHEMEIRSLEAEKVRLEEKRAAKENASKKKKALHAVSATEKKYQKLMAAAEKIQETVEKVRNVASASFKIPDFSLGAVTNAFGGPRFDMESLGGTKLAENLVSAAESYASRFAQKQLDAAKIKLQAEWERRQKEWILEEDAADAEVVEIKKQELVNEIKTQQVEKKRKNFEAEVRRSEETYEILSEKFTNESLYVWLEKELGKTFQKFVRLLVETAKMAEKAYLFEIESVDTFIGTDYWNGLYKGLAAPEKILYDLRRMEKAYLENDRFKVAVTEPIVVAENLGPQIAKGNCSFVIDGLAEKLAESAGSHILDVRLQIICEEKVPLYTRLYAKISSTGEDSTDFGDWATGMALVDADKFDFRFQGNQYLPFEGMAVSGASFTITITANSNVNFSNAKLILFVTHTL